MNPWTIFSDSAACEVVNWYRSRCQLNKNTWFYMQDTDKVRTSLLNFMPYSNIEASLKICEQEISENNNSNNSNNNAFDLLSSPP